MRTAIAKMNWNDAQAYCSSLGEGWRLPSIEELKAMVGSTSHWSDVCGVAVDLWDGYTTHDYIADGQELHYVWPVRGDREQLIPGNSAGRKEEKMEIVNLTPHEISIITSSSNGDACSPTITTVAIPPSGEILRLDYSRISGVLYPVDAVNPGLRFVDFPPPVEGRKYVASMPVALEAARIGRRDIFAPDTDHGIRDKAGKILGVPGLIRFATQEEIDQRRESSGD